MLKNKTDQDRNDENYNQTGIAVKIHTNRDNDRTITIMLRFTAASSSWGSPVVALKQASQVASAAFRVNNWELALITFSMRWVEDHISHRNRVLRYCHPVQSSRSWKLGCRSFIKCGETHNYVSCFFPHFFRAPAASCVFYIRKDHRQSFSIT